VLITVPTAVALWPWRGPALLDDDGVTQAMGSLGLILIGPYVLMLGAAWPA
jgi:hypothetical protein